MNGDVAVGRVMRFEAGTWRPVGEPLPPFAHAPPTPEALFAPWVLPRDLRVTAFDVVVVGELAHQLMARCGPDDPAVEALAAHTAMLHEPADAAAWLAQVEVWTGRRLDQRRPWPEPPSPATG